MKITGVKTHVYSTPWRNLIYFRMQTDEGIEGISEIRVMNHTDALLGYLEEAVPNYVLDHDPFEIEALVRKLYRNDFIRPGQLQMAAMAGLEVACWDIVGKAVNRPIYQLMGGAVRDSIKAYANGWYRVERTPDEFAKAAQKVTATGYRALKLDPLGAGYLDMNRAQKAQAVDLVAAVREAIGPDVDIMVEMHGRLNRINAIDVARQLEPIRPAWIEEPVPPENLKTLRDVMDHVNLPVATGERLHSRHEFRELFELRAADIIQPDIMHAGGLLEVKKIAAWAESYYMLVAPHNVGGPVATAAALHFAACTPNFMVQEHFNDFADSDVKTLVTGLPEVVDGAFGLPNGPGLGVQLDIERLEHTPRKKVFFDLYDEDWHLRQNPITPEA